MIKDKTSETAVPTKSRLVNGSPVYFGWVVMLAGTLGMIMTSPGQTYAVSIFIEHFIDDLGVSRSLVSTLYTAGTLGSSFALPWVGRMIDKRGPRSMVVTIALVFGAACIYMGFVSNAVMLGLGFLAIRMFGQGSLGLVSTNVINQWWVRRRGAVLGISGVIMSVLGLGAFPSLLNWLIPQTGWRAAYMILGAVLLFVMAPLGHLLFRNRPEEYGLRPDGDAVTGGEEVESLPRAEEDWLPSQATRTFAFWILAIGSAAIAMLATGLFFHMVDIFAANGLSTSVAAAVYAPLAVATAVTNLSSGFLVGRVPVRYMLAGALLLQAASLWMAQYLQGTALAFVYGIILGATMGLARTVGTVSWAMYFGRKHLGSINGISTSILVGGSALGPLPLGLARDLVGSYNTALSVLAMLPLLLAILALFARRPTLAETADTAA